MSSRSPPNYPSAQSWEAEPDPDVLEKEWLGHARRLAGWKKALDLDKKVLIGEVGYRSIDFTHKEPWRTSGIIKKGCSGFNEELQAQCYEAILKALDGIAWLDGLFLWQEAIHEPPQYYLEHNLEYSIINKKAALIIQKYYSRLYENPRALAGNWYYFKDEAEATKIFVDGKETMSCRLKIKEIEESMEQVARLSGTLSPGTAFPFIGMGLNLDEQAKEALGAAAGISFKTIANADGFICRIETKAADTSMFYSAEIAVSPGTLTTVRLEFDDFRPSAATGKAPLERKQIQSLSFIMNGREPKSLRLEIFDLKSIE